MTALSAAVLISPTLRAGEEHGLDFEVRLRGGVSTPPEGFIYLGGGV